MGKIIVAALCSFFLGAVLAGTEPAWTFEYKKLSGEYAIYGGGLGDERPPTSADKKISLSFAGKAAKDVFDLIGPDVKDTCGTEGGTRIRMRNGGKVSCSFNKSEGYLCYVGFDLHTGKSIAGVIC